MTQEQAFAHANDVPKNAVDGHLRYSGDIIHIPGLVNVDFDGVNTPSVTTQPHSYEGLTPPSVWRSARSQAAAKVDAYTSSGMDEIEIPAFLRKQAD